MQLARHRINAPAHGRPLKIYPLGDVHLGAAACDIDHFRKVRDMIVADPDARWIGMGDAGDLIMPSDPRWSFSGHDWKRLGWANGRPDVDNLAVEHRDIIAREHDPIADKCLGIHRGNHEKELARRLFVDVDRFLAQRYGVPWLDASALTRIEIVYPPRDRGGHKASNVWAITIFSEHGANGGGTEGNAVNKLQERAREFEADVYLKGHVHKRGITHRPRLGWGLKRIAHRDQLFVLTGTYLKGYTEHETTYGEYKGYPPNQIGGTVLILNTRKRRVRALDVEAFADAAEVAA